MHDLLLKYIENYAASQLTSEQSDLIKSVFLHKKIRKKQYFLQEGEVCKYAAFIVKGAMQQYSVDDKGAEHIIRLSIENWWAVDRESFVMLTPSLYNIVAWEDTDILYFTRADSLILLNQIPAFAQMARKLDENYASSSQRRLNASISFSAEKRFADFAICYPEILQRFPQHMIASYLGITKETLSRVRKQTMKA